MTEPTCHNCKIYGTQKCPDSIGYKHDYDTICFEHPRIKEHLMQEIIRKIQCQSEIADRCGMIEHSRGLKEAISLIQGGLNENRNNGG